MNTLKLHRHPHLTNSGIQIPSLIPTEAKFKPALSSSSFPKSSLHVVCSKSRRTTSSADKLPLEGNTSPKLNVFSAEELPVEFSRAAVLGAVSLGLAVFLMGCDGGHKALALGPEGPLMEEFWDNMRRYGLYVLTVSTGAIYTLMQPIVELLRNPISAILVLLIFGGGIFIVSQVVTAMVGLSDFSYDYGY